VVFLELEQSFAIPHPEGGPKVFAFDGLFARPQEFG